MFKVPEFTGGLIAEGSYEVILKDGGYMDTTKGGTVYLNIPMVIRNDVDQKFQNAIVWDSIWVNGSERGINYKVGAISNAVGLTAGAEFKDIEDWGRYLKGKAIRITVKHNEYNGNINAQPAFYAKTAFPDVKHVFKSKSVAVVPDEADFEEIPVPDDGDCPF